MFFYSIFQCAWGNEDIPTAALTLPQQISASIWKPISLSLSLSFKPHFHIRVKLIFEAFHTFMLICTHTFVVQQHASLCGASICRDALWTDKGLTASSSGFTYHSWAIRERCLSVHISLFLISTDWTLFFFFLFFLALSSPLKLSCASRNIYAAFR